MGTMSDDVMSRLSVVFMFRIIPTPPNDSFGYNCLNCLETF